ncbi:MAG TPA: hypothetical protein VII56_06985 [Rhizomicrobium sp.]
MRIFGAAAIVAAASALSACIPMRAYDVPTVHIRVIDSRTSAPLAGASVIVMTGGDRAPPYAATAADGTATLGPVAHWTLIFVNLDPLPSSRTLEIHAPGYVTKLADICFYGIKQTPVVSLTVALESGSGPQSRVRQQPGPCF